MKTFREYLVERENPKGNMLQSIRGILIAGLLAVGLATSIFTATQKVDKYINNNETKIEKMTNLEAEQEDVARIAKELSIEAAEKNKSMEEVAEKAKELSINIFKDYKKIPQNFSQAGYSATGIGEEGYYFGDKNKTMKNLKKISSGTSQEKIHKLWKKQGMNFKNGIATIKDEDGDNRFMVAVTDTFGKIGDRINFKLENGDVINCIISDLKDRKDANWSKYGHKYETPSGREQINILEFQVDRNKWNQTKYIDSKSWGLPWADKILKNGELERNNVVSWYNIDENKKGKDTFELALK